MQYIMVLQEKTPYLDRDRFIREIIIPTGVSASVVSAFEEVDRAEFMYRANRGHAHTDRIIDVGQEATVSQPSFVAKMIELLQLEGRERVLEVGTATGYQAALLSRLAEHVDTVEINPQLAYWAQSNHKRLHYPNITVHQGDGLRGVPERAPFDAIIVTAALRGMPKTLMDQLAVGGRMVAPVGSLPEDCRLKLYTKNTNSGIGNQDIGPCGFVPLYSTEVGGWDKESLRNARARKEEEIETAQAARRQKLKDTLVAQGGSAAYEGFLRAIGGSLVRIMDTEPTETQILDLTDFFSSIFGPKETAVTPEPPLVTEETTGMDNQAHGLPPETTIKE